MVVGEPGIGKTALCEQLGTFVSAAGGTSLVGHCYPEGSFRPPYYPFVRALESYVRECDPEVLGSSADELARILPTLRERYGLSPRQAGDPEEDHWRLLQAATHLLRTAATHHPVLLMLEDLHDADRGTLDLLLHVARNLQDTRLLVVGTYRDVEVDRAHPLSAALGELHRVSQFERMQLGELSADDVQRLMAASSHRAISRPLAELVHRRSGGNPLFAHELLRFLLGERLLEERDGTLRRVGDESLAGQMPEGLRDVVGKRLSRLSGTANQVLGVASVIGREFTLEVLRRVQSRTEEELESALEEAVGAAIVDERLVAGATVTYRFSHAFFQQTLSDEIMAPRRIRLHQQIARVLEGVHARRLEEHAAELAEHYSFSSDPGDLAKAVEYATLAARRATEVFAYGEAARQLERALVVQDLVDPDDRCKRCDLLLGLAETLFPAGETDRVITQVAPEAVALAEALGDRVRAFRACRLAVACLYAQGAGIYAAQPAYLTWAERAAEYAEPASIERCHADLALAQARWSRGEFPQAWALRLEALALARQHADPEALFTSAYSVAGQSAPWRWNERVQLVEEGLGWPRQGVSGQALGWMLWICGGVQLAQGERARAEDLWKQVEELAARTHAVELGLHVASRDVALAIIDGRLEDALALARRFVERAHEAGAATRGRQFGLLMLICPVLYLGRTGIWLDAFDEYIGPATLAGRSRLAVFTVNLTAARALCLAQLGRVAEARTFVGPLLNEFADGRVDQEFPMGPLAILLQAALVFEHRDAARALSTRLAPVAHLTVTETRNYTGVARLLGDAAKLVDDRASARAYYTQALLAAEKIRFRPELALTHLSLAELLLEEGEDTKAQEQLELAVRELREMKMQPALERALGLLEQFERATPAASADNSHVLTSREREVSRLVATGKSNHEIADVLVITEGTVEVHVKHILSKLGFRSRAQVAAWASDQRL
jgi:DNA-binding CsgD family transcriptional regulator